jgi:hypothetical protein
MLSLVSPLPRGLAAQDAEPQEGALFLLLPVGARAVGLARAMTALSTPEAPFWNPAGIAPLDRPSVLLYQGDHVAGDGLGLSFLFPSSRDAESGGPVLAASYSLLDAGTQDLTDEFGTVLGSITVRGHQAVASMATRLSDGLDVGVNVKWVEFRVGCRGQCMDAEVRANTYAFDLGVQFRPLPGVQIGALLAHAGPHLRVQGSDQSEPLPARLRIAAAYEARREVAGESLVVRVLAEGEERPRALGDPSYFLGTELVAGTEDRVFVRGGYVFGSLNQTDGAAIGLGLVYARYEFAIARSLARGGPALDQEPVHLTVGIAF